MGPLGGVDGLDHDAPVGARNTDVRVPVDPELLEVLRIELDDSAGLAVGGLLLAPSMALSCWIIYQVRRFRWIRSIWAFLTLPVL